MATSVPADQQMSLTVAPRTSTSHLNKPARSLVPAFLQKLYEMVNDPADDLIKWSDTGDSFFVLDQERFANEVLGRWFKHKNFSSFVRQLNMYGFHKIPHLQQGVLRSESETEFWNFEHPNFIRGQPDMLCLIQRKKQAQSANNSTDEAHVQGTTMRDGVGVGGTAVGLSQNQLLDINSIVNGIQAIKRHQETISADLNELKVSNQHLWQEAMLSRERHKKHQDIINRIVKFLGGLFGHTERIHRNGGGHTGSHAVVARKPQRLMIGDGKDGKKMGDVNEDGGCSARSPESTSLFESMNTPSAVPSEPLMSPRFASVEPSVTDAPTPADTRPQPRPVQIDNNDNHEPSHPLNSFTTTTAAQESQQNHNDAMVQVALTQVLNSPSQMQKLLHALQSQSISPDMFAHQPQQQLIAPYDGTHYGSDNSSNTAMDVHTDHPRTPPYDFSTAVANAPPSPFSLSLLGGGGDDASDADQLIPFEKHDERLEKTYRTAAEINHDVNELQSSINSLIQTLGLDPGSLDVSGHHEHTDGVGDLNGNSTSAMNGSSISNGVGLGGEGDMDMFTNNGPDFDFDAFLMDMPRTTDEDEGDLERLAEQLDPAAAAAVAAVHDPQARLAGRSSEQLHAFLDDVASQDRGDVGPIAGSSHIGFAPVSAPAPGAGAGSSHSFSSTLANGVGASPSSFTRPPTSSAGPVSGSTASRGRKRKSEVTDAGDDSPLPQTTITPSSSVATNKSKRKR
ncbi:hypothetical protein SCLCIDRAFT_1218516 [Scleroderma citrinum Foug A]|uniref:HSF-type DNA-binding domain-containing protein n=1 Tax=Scleroderma citrinum Foug A TaxID=1036808 RepID=A0A0C3DCW2_9AGAM|nr:hypothetical protein SCLCIDRAFT_1218516 [Scleroderma citrinum Foug A]